MEKKVAFLVYMAIMRYMVFWSKTFSARGTRLGSLLLDQTGLVSGEKKHHKISYHLINNFTHGE